jgi:hypothetical protein
MVQSPVPGLFLQDGQTAFQGNRALIRTVLGREGVEHVGDGHGPALDGNLGRAQAPGITATREPFMVGIGDLGNAREVPGPGDALQEPEGMGDMAFDFEPL